MDARSVRLAWAAKELGMQVDAGLYGKVIFNFQDGIIVNANIESNRKPPIDNEPKAS